MLPFEFDFNAPDYAAVFAHRAEKLQKIRANPQMLPALLAYYKDHPAQFIIDWGCTADPRNIEVGLPAIIPFILFPRQIEWIEWAVDKWKCQDSSQTVKSRDMGISWLSIALGCTLSLTHKDLVIGYGSRKEEYVDKIGSPKSLFHKARMFMSLLPPEFRGGFDQFTTAPHMRLMFPSTGAVMVGEAGDGIGRGDRASIYFVDEAAFLERPQLVEASLSMTTNCRLDVSTVNGLTNPFAEKVLSGKYDSFRFHWREDPRKDDAWYAKQVEKLDPVTVAQEIDINFSASVDGVLIPSEWIQSAIDAHEKLGIDPTGEKVTALDVADRGKDTNAHSCRNGILLTAVEEWHGKTVDDIYGTTQKAADNCDDWKCYKLKYDSDGLGAGVRGDSRVINETRSHSIKLKTTAFHGSGGVLNKDEEFIEGRTNGEFFENFKAQSWWMLRERFKVTHEAVTQNKPYEIGDLICIPSDLPARLKLEAELSQPTFSKTGRGKVIVDKAPKGTKSPNVADSIMMLYSPDKELVIDYDKLL